MGKNYFKRSLGKQVTQNEFKLVEHVVAPDQGTQLVLRGIFCGFVRVFGGDFLPLLGVRGGC